jgi:signal peptidase I
LSERTEPAAAAEPAPAEQTKVKAESRGQLVWREIKGLIWVLLAVLAFHSFIAKPFYIPSESMMPNLLTGDRLVVTKYPYGWSYVSPTIPNPAAILRNVLLRRSEPWTITLPFMKGRIFGSLPQRGDIVIVTPPGGSQDYIKRVIGLPGDTIEVRAGRVILNGQPIQAVARPPVLIPVDTNSPCSFGHFYEDRIVQVDQGEFCRLPIVHETLPNGVSYNTIDDVNGSDGDNYGPVKIPADRLFLMGDNRDHSADSRFSLVEQGLGGPVPIENIGGRAEFITFSLDGSTQLSSPSTWFSAFRAGRAGTSLRPAKD